MRKSIDELNQIPPDYRVDRDSEIAPPPDEFNRFPKQPESKKKPSSMRKVMLYLASIGIVTLGVITPLIRLRSQGNGQTIPSATPTAAAEATPTPEITASPTPIPTPTPTPAPTPVKLTGEIQYVVFADAFCTDLGMEGGYEIAVLDYGTFDAETFTEYKLPPLPEREGYTAVGYVLLAESGFDYFNGLYFDGVQPHTIGSVALGDTLKAQDLGIVPQNADGVRQVEIHTVWTEDNGKFAIEFYDGDTLFNKADAGFPTQSDGLVYLAAFPTPEHEGLIFNGWYDSTGNKIDAVTWFDFYPTKPDAKSLEDRDWQKNMPCRLYASYMDPYGNEQQPEIPLPDCHVIFYQTHSVSNAVITFSDRWHTTGVHIRIWDEQVQDSVMEYDLTPQEFASGMWEETGIDPQEFYHRHADTYEQNGWTIRLVLEATLTYRLQDGTVGSVTRSAEAKPEDYPFVRFHDANEEPNEYTFPDCFVCEIFDAVNENNPFVIDPDQELQPGEFRVTVAVDNITIPTDLYRVEHLTDTWEYEGVTYTNHAYFLVMQRPHSFPPHGEAIVTIEHQFLHYGFATTDSQLITY